MVPTASGAALSGRRCARPRSRPAQGITAVYQSRTRFLTDLTLDPPSATSDEAGAPLLDEDYLILSTIHSANGQEWKIVFVLNVVDGCIPSDMSTGNTDDIEEERRLLYVAMTRAKDQLALVMPHRFYVHGQARGGDKHLYASRTRFIPAGIVSTFDVCAWPPVVRTNGSSAVRPGATIDLAARMRGMWRYTEAGMLAGVTPSAVQLLWERHFRPCVGQVANEGDLP